MATADGSTRRSVAGMFERLTLISMKTGSMDRNVTIRLLFVVLPATVNCFFLSINIRRRGYLHALGILLRLWTPLGARFINFHGVYCSCISIHTCSVLILMNIVVLNIDISILKYRYREYRYCFGEYYTIGTLRVSAPEAGNRTYASYHCEWGVSLVWGISKDSVYNLASHRAWLFWNETEKLLVLVSNRHEPVAKMIYNSQNIM